MRQRLFSLFLKIKQRPFLSLFGAFLIFSIGFPAYRWMTLPRFGGQDINYWWEQSGKLKQPLFFGLQTPPSVDITMPAFKGMGQKGGTFIVRKYVDSFDDSLYERLYGDLSSRVRNRNNITFSDSLWIKVLATLPPPGKKYLDRSVADRILMDLDYPTEFAEKEIARTLRKSRLEINHELLRFIGKICTSRTNILSSVETSIRKNRLTPSVALPLLMKYDYPLNRCIPALGTELCQVDSRNYSALSLFQNEAIGKTNLLAYIGKALKNKDPRFRAMLIQKIAQFGPQASNTVPDLIACLDDEWYFVRAESATALAAIGPGAKSAISKLATLQNDPHSDVTNEAARAKAILESFKAEN